MTTLNKTAKTHTIEAKLEEGEKHFWILGSETKFQATISGLNLAAFPNGAIGIISSGWIEIFPVGSAESRHFKLEESECDKILELTELAEELKTRPPAWATGFPAETFDKKINNIIAEKIATMLAAKWNQ